MTVILVTHFMEEAERLADRIAVIDAGRVVALDTPAGIVSRGRRRSSGSGSGRRRPIDDGLLTDLPEVRSVTPARPDGRGRPAPATSSQAVTSVLARNQIVANDLRIEQADLDDAFVALTGRKLAS